MVSLMSRKTLLSLNGSLKPNWSGHPMKNSYTFAPSLQFFFFLKGKLFLFALRRQYPCNSLSKVRQKQGNQSQWKGIHRGKLVGILLEIAWLWVIAVSSANAFKVKLKRCEATITHWNTMTDSTIICFKHTVFHLSQPCNEFLLFSLSSAAEGFQ